MKYQPPFGSPGTNDPYVNGDPTISRRGSILPAGAAEYPQREIVNFIGNSARVPSDNDLQQLTRSTRDQWVNFCVDSGAVNSLSVALTPALQEYKQGLPLRVLVANSNTGASVINVNSLGARPIKRANGAQLVSGDLVAGMIALLVDDGTVFQLVNYLGAIAGITNNYTIHIPYAEDIGTPNVVIANYLPPITTVAAGDLVLVKLKNTNTAAVMITMNAMAPQPLRRNDGQPLQSGDVLAGECILIEYNTTYWQMIRLVKSQVYFKLTANLILYVRTDGNDINDGSINDAAHAFRTIQAAIDYVQRSFLIAGRTVTIQLGIPGTYGPKSVVIGNLPGSLIIRGDPANKLAYVILGATQSVVVGMSGSGTQVSLAGVTLSPNYNLANVIEVDYGATFTGTDLAFSGSGTTGSAISSFAGTVILANNFDLYSPLGAFIGGYNASFTIGLWYTVINVHGISFYTAFVACTYSYIAISAGWCTFAGYGYGYKYLAYYNSAINVGGGGADYLPGNIAGGVDASSVYG